MSSVTLDQAIAATRFGLGTRPGDYTRMRGNPKAWLKSQTRPGSSSVIHASLPTMVDYCESHWAASHDRIMSMGIQPSNIYDGCYHLHINARTRFAQITTQSFRERFVQFWSNHFSISLKGMMGGITPAFEAEAIRPKVMHSFYDLLVSVEMHPLMLDFLDNTSSFGPNSPFGKRSGLTINENLAREILELHTLGFDAGYTQQDIIELAKAITGWTFGTGLNGLPRPYGKFYFNADAHEPGPVTVLGKTYNQPGIEKGLAILKDLAAHPATARRLARKIAVHFHSDEPPESLVNALANAYRASGGSLSKVAQALADAPEMWTASQHKVKNSIELWTSVWRAISPAWHQDLIFAGFYGMGQTPFGSASPAGWPESAESWASAGILRQRFSVLVGNAWWFESALTVNPVTLAETNLGPLLSEHTKSAIATAPSRGDAFVTLFMSPEFQRR